ncbi:toxin-antitoxin system HicB family antitoxin [Candidatus Rickettsia kedanie]
MPDKPFNGSVNVRIEPALHKEYAYMRCNTAIL